LLCYEEWLEEIKDKVYPEECYSIAEELIGNESYSEEDIQEFCKKLRDYANEDNFSKTGLFISALINRASSKDITIYLGELGDKLCYLGYENEKNLRIIGNAGEHLGENMREGKLRVEGRISKMGKPRGGEIYEGSKLIYPGKLKIMLRRIACSLRFGRR